MLFLVPPAEIIQEPMPKQVWATLKDARRAAIANQRSLVMFVPEDKARFSAALAFFKSLDGMKARREAEVWLPQPGNSDAIKLLDELGLRSLPVLATLSMSGKQSVRSFLGEECVPLAPAFQRLFENKPVPNSQVQDWIGQNLTIEPFLAFAAARKANMGAAATEPHRSWLVGLVGGKDERVRNWAATRLLEADAPIQANEPRPFPILFDFLHKRFQKEVRQGNTERAKPGADGDGEPKGSSFAGSVHPPLADLGLSGLIHEKAPFWPAIRGFLKNDPLAKVNIPLYVLMAPQLKEADRDWIVSHLVREGKETSHGKAHLAVLYWIATDWLLAYGNSADWDAFQGVMVPFAWDAALAELRKELQKVPGYWDSQPGIQSMFCEGQTQESFWENPDACLAAWGITREALVEFGMDKMKSKGTPTPPRYPPDALRMGFSSNLKLRMVVGSDGNTKWVRPEPGYALSFFAPAGMAYAMRWRFEPARVAGVPRPSQFRLTMPFALKKN